MKRVSTARAKQLREYAKLKREFLQRNHYCFVCRRFIYEPNRELHHVCGRIGRLLTWVIGFRTACGPCHKAIHDNPAWAFETGLLGPRECWNDFDRAVKHHEQQKDTK